MLALRLFLWRRFFSDDLLISSSEFKLPNFDVFPVWLLLSCLIMQCFPFNILVMVILKSRHDTSVVTSHVDHVVGFGVFVVSPVSSLG